MNKQMLAKLLNQEGFRPDYYDLSGGLLPERLTLGREGDRWIVYYSEHGLQTGKQYFENEADACEYFLAQLRDEPFARQ